VDLEVNVTDRSDWQSWITPIIEAALAKGANEAQFMAASVTGHGIVEAKRPQVAELFRSIAGGIRNA
jgi:hypothetical protein